MSKKADDLLFFGWKYYFQLFKQNSSAELNSGSQYSDLWWYTINDSNKMFYFLSSLSIKKSYVFELIQFIQDEMISDIYTKMYLYTYCTKFR